VSYENTSCPCGGKKPCDTMLCDGCNEAFKDRTEMRDYQDIYLSLELRRNAAVILVTLARKRRRK
jgi:hypothetical protein